jgi:hypothetical protein
MSLNGVWYDPDHDGCGFAFVANRFGSQVFFFGHDPAGQQLWLTGYGEPTAGISLTYSHGRGFPTHTVEHEPAVGTLKLGAVGDGRMEIEVTLPLGLIGPGATDFSPPPPTRTVVFRCVPIELSGQA